MEEAVTAAVVVVPMVVEAGFMAAVEAASMEAVVDFMAVEAASAQAEAFAVEGPVACITAARADCAQAAHTEASRPATAAVPTVLPMAEVIVAALPAVIVAEQGPIEAVPMVLPM
jgi:hypothetical protein